VESAFDYLTDELGVPSNRVIIMGRSLGTGPSCHLAARLSSGKKGKNPAGLILQSPFLSAIRVVFSTPVTLPIDIFPNLSNITKVKFPIMIIHGTEDKVINVEHGRQLVRIARKSRSNKDVENVVEAIINDAGHNDIETNYQAKYISFLTDFLARAKKYTENLEKNNNNSNNNSNSMENLSSTKNSTSGFSQDNM